MTLGIHHRVNSGRHRCSSLISQAPANDVQVNDAVSDDRHPQGVPISTIVGTNAG
jgi:hypothetical protein